MKVSEILLACLLILFLTGCADIMPPTPEELMKNPLGPDSVKVGMTKNQVKDLWGEPDQINRVTNEEKWGGSREEWVYFARFSELPVGADYLSKTKRLYFDGENLTTITEVD